MIYTDIFEILNKYLGEKLTIRQIRTKIDLELGNNWNTITVGKRLARLWTRSKINREKDPEDNHTLLYWLDEPIDVNAEATDILIGDNKRLE